MDEFIAALDKACSDYRQDVRTFLDKSRPTDGLLGFGRSLKDDSCHDRFDKALEQAVSLLAKGGPSPDDAQQAIRMLLSLDMRDQPEAVQWMLRAVERHCLVLVPFLSSDAADGLYREYAKRYRPWDRLPVQKQLLQALKGAAAQGK